jgi:ATP adenylyltransferase
LDRLWSPWRYQYIASGSNATDKRPDSCVFCDLQKDPGTDEEKLILYRAKYCFVALNLFPYTSGHSLVVPYLHIADLDAAPKEITTELIDLTKVLQTAMRKVYKPDGFNIGMNQGSAAGAGVAGHLHMHILPRWVGDANFVSTIGETRVLPETLGDTYRRLKNQLNAP